VLDTETTGLEVGMGHRVIEIAAVEILNRRLTGRHFHRYLNPQREIEAGALQVHGISLDFLQDKPLFRDVAAEFLEFVRGAELIIHNAAFDVAFLDAELSLAQLSMAANAPMLTRSAMVEGRLDAGILPTGQVAGILEELPTVAELLTRIMAEANATLERLTRTMPERTLKP